MTSISGNNYALAQPSPGTRRHRPIPYYRVDDPAKFKLKSFASVKHLKLAWLDLKESGGQAPGIDGLSFKDYSPSEMFDVLRYVTKSLVELRYHPYEVRIHRIAKGDGRFRELSIQCIPDRVVAKCLQQCFDGYWRLRLPNIGRSVIDVFADLQQMVRRHQTFYLQIDDIADCFPSAPLNKIIECQNHHFQGTELRWLADQIIRGHEGVDKETGIGQGSPYSPVAVEALLHHHFDTELEARYQGNLLLTRFVDNVTFAVRSESQGQEILQLATEILNEIGFQLKGKDGCVDLRDPNHNTVLLGLVPRWQDGQLMFSVPAKAYEGLDDSLLEATITDYPDKTAKLVANGWLRASSPALTTAVRNDVVSDVISMARKYGFNGLNRQELLIIAKGSRDTWIERCSHD